MTYLSISGLTPAICQAWEEEKDSKKLIEALYWEFEIKTGGGHSLEFGAALRFIIRKR